MKKFGGKEFCLERMPGIGIITKCFPNVSYWEGSHFSICIFTDIVFKQICILTTLGRCSFGHPMDIPKMPHCTMRFPMSIDFLEIHRCKNSFLAHFIVKSIHSFCRRCKTAQIFTKEKKYNFFDFFCDFFVENAEGGV